MRNRDGRKGRRKRQGRRYDGRQYDGVLRDALLAAGLFCLVFLLIALLQALGWWESVPETESVFAGIGGRACPGRSHQERVGTPPVIDAD